MEHEIEVFASSAEVTAAGASLLARWSRAAAARQGECSIAVSGGHTPLAMFAALAEKDVPWDQVTLFQVDERIAPAGDADRNLTHLRSALQGVVVTVVPMPVEAPDLESAALRYEQELPHRLDIVHLGIGPDGHTASLVPDDPVLQVTDRRVALTETAYQGRRRMTLTYPALARASQLLWIVTGQDKREALARMLKGDRDIPAGRVQGERSLVLADRAAVGSSGSRLAGALR